jgi:hypothetical protein
MRQLAEDAYRDINSLFFAVWEDLEELEEEIVILV